MNESHSPPPRRRMGPILGAIVAFAVSVGCVWWFTRPADTEAPSPALARAMRPPIAPAAAATAPERADAAQVQRAFEAVQDAFADGGVDGLARANADCAAALKGDGRVLDYCLAFDLFSTAVAPQIARTDPDAARMAEARAALPAGVDAGARLAEVRALMRQASLGAAEPRAPSARAAKPVRIAAPAGPHRASPAVRRERRAAAAKAIKTNFAWKTPNPCLGPTMAERLLCRETGHVHSTAPDGPRARDAAALEEAPH